ncbi:SusC/RagA family TonB-linked outer membrane protein [Cytophagales bacterium WSM2-2]|nr:SusC/RagA family TonB-linked outer membrane protein [Cytophagales bacterium WSM2-2]
MKFYQSILLSLCFTWLTTVALAQSRTVTGTVKDPNGAGLPGVTIQVKGTASGTVSDSDGKYAIAVGGENAVVVFSFIGFATQEIQVGSQSVIDVSLAEDTKQLQEVIVTALGVEKDSKTLGYSVTKVDASSITQARETNMINSLEGRVAGVNISGTNGGPGSSSSIVIRGINSLGGSNPLFVINGVPIDNTTRGSAGQYGGVDQGDGISNLNPDDIKELTVLKGATASALYGSRAANGVIIITTKTGKDRKGFGLEYNGNLTFDQAINYHDFQDQYGQGLNGLKPVDQTSAYNSGQSSWGAKLDGSSVPQFDGVSRPYSAQKDNFKNFYRTGSTFTNTISIGNSNENGSYRFSASDLANKSIVPNSGLSRNTFNLNVNYKIVPKLTFDLMSNYIIENFLNRPNLSDSPGNPNFGISFLPTSLNASVLSPGTVANGNESNFSSNVYVTNPYFAVNKFINNTSRNRVINVVSLKYSFTNWLTLQGRVGNDIYFDNYTSVTPTGTAYLPKGGMNQVNSKGIETNADFLLTANKKITDDITLTGSIGGNLRKSSLEKHTVSGQEFAIHYLYTTQNLVSRSPLDELYRREVQSYYYTAEFSYKNFLTLNTTGRQDKFSVLDGRSIFYPSVGASFVFSDLLNFPKLSFGKFRASWANSTGNPDQYIYSTNLYYSINSSSNGHPIGTINNVNIPDKNLKPFLMKEFEFGLDLRFLDNRIGLDISYYNRKTTQELINATTSVTSGYVGAAFNAADLQNSGIELMLRGTPVKSSNLTWNVSFNFTKNTNEVTSLANGLTDITVQGGISRSGNAFINHEVGKAASQVMAFDYKRDANGNIAYDDSGLPIQGKLTAYGSGYHNTFGGIMNEFVYKGFNIAFLIDYKYGGKIFSATDYYAYIFGLHKNTLVGREGESIVGVGVNDKTGLANTVSAKPWDYDQAIATNVSSQFVYDASFIKLRQITIGYKLPQALFNGTPIKGATFSLVARNLAILMKHTPNIDPESNYSNTVGQGLELAGVPPARNIGFNLNLKF